MISLDKIWKELSTISDPEIPVISILELGVLRDVKFVKNTLNIIITPTYSGCPAMNQIEKDISVKLLDLGVDSYKINLQYNPAWTTDWMNDGPKKNYLITAYHHQIIVLIKGVFLEKTKAPFVQTVSQETPK